MVSSPGIVHSSLSFFNVPKLTFVVLSMIFFNIFMSEILPTSRQDHNLALLHFFLYSACLDLYLVADYSVL